MDFLDTLYLIALKLNDKDLLSLSMTNKYFYEKIFLKDRIWNNKVKCKLNNNISVKQNYILIKALTNLKEKLSISFDVFEIYGSRQLALPDKGIITIPEEITYLTNLKSLFLHRNFIKDIPSYFWNLTNLETLSMSYNCIETIPEDISKLTNLKQLYLHENKITDIKVLSKLTQIEIINLEYNDISIFPEELKFLPKLEVMDIRHNIINKYIDLRYF